MYTGEVEAVQEQAVQAAAISLQFLGKALALALALLVVANGWLFLFYYGDTLTPLALPYRENFENLQRLDYRQFGGQWRLRNNRLVQHDTREPDLLAVIPLTLAPDQKYQFGVRLKLLQGAKGGGLLFNLQHPNSRQQSHLVRFGSAEGRDYLVFGYFDENLHFVEQGSVEQGSLPPPDISQGVELAVLVHAQTYDVLVNGQPQQRAIPLKHQGGSVALTTWFSSVAFDDLHVTALAEGQAEASPQTSAKAEKTPDPVTTPAVARTPFATLPAGPPLLAMPPITETLSRHEQFSSNGDQTLWTPLSGNWQVEDGALVQQSPNGYDYSIRRAGVFARFVLSVHFRHRQGVGGGILFNMPKDDTQRHGHLVRYFADQSLAWGYFDQDNVFTGQGYVAVDPPGAQLHTLQVIVGDTAYSVLLDNQMVAQNVPLVSTQGYLGLTASKSIVAFEEITITEIQ